MDEIRGDMLIGEIVARYPNVLPVFLKYGLHCVGCRVSPYETLEEGSFGHGMPKEVYDAMLAEANEKLREWQEQQKGQGAGSKLLWITEKAAEQIKKIAASEGKQGIGLRVSIEEGGCAGHSYQMDFEAQPTENDVVIEAHELKIFFSRELNELIAGATIDYREALQGGGFVMQNPNAKASCSCGQSFSV